MEKILIHLVAAIILIACNRAPLADIRAEAEAIIKIEDRWTAAILAKDTDKIMSIFAPEAVAMNANTPTCIGAQAIRESLGSWFADATILHETFKSAIDTVEVSASGDLAYVRGNSQINISTPNGIVNETDKWITIYRKINGEWRAIVDIWNSDMP